MANQEVKCGHVNGPCVREEHPVAAHQKGLCIGCRVRVHNPFAGIGGHSAEGVGEDHNNGTVDDWEDSQPE
jgi:hypothetical protein